MLLSCFLSLNSRPQFQNLTLSSVDTESDGRIRSAPGKCFINETKCRYDFINSNTMNKVGLLLHGFPNQGFVVRLTKTEMHH